MKTSNNNEIRVSFDNLDDLLTESVDCKMVRSKSVSGELCPNFSCESRGLCKVLSKVRRLKTEFSETIGRPTCPRCSNRPMYAVERRLPDGKKGSPFYKCNKCGMEIESKDLDPEFEKGWPDWRTFAEPRQSLIYQLKRAAEWIAAHEPSEAENTILDFLEEWNKAEHDFRIGSTPETDRLLEALKRIASAEDGTALNGIREIARDTIGLAGKG